jgi:hypothetical protein
VSTSSTTRISLASALQAEVEMMPSTALHARCQACQVPAQHLLNKRTIGTSYTYQNSVVHTVCMFSSWLLALGMYLQQRHKNHFGQLLPTRV